MPTARTTAFLLTALLLYFFANQTQVGWIYVMAAVMAGTVLAAWWMGRNALKGIAAERQVLPSDPTHEGETVSVQLTFRDTRSDSHVRTTEHCPFAPPDEGLRAAPVQIFIPSLSPRAPVQLNYQVVADRRGLHEFPPLLLASPAPFGLFRRRRTLALATRVLIYPELRPLARLALFDRQPAALLTRPRPGPGTEFIGVRPFRSGDSPRHIHWRSMARTGQLISKEFADDSQPGVTLAIDLYRHPYPPTESKHTPFEWMVKAAASIGDYAQRRHYALHLLADDSAWAPPPGPISHTALLEYLARVQPTGGQTLAGLLGARPTQAFVAVLLAWPDPSVVESILALKHMGCEVLAVVLDPQSFPAGGPPAGPLADSLRAANVDTRWIRFGSDWMGQLDEPGVGVPLEKIGRVYG
jgi:uncharacterized protein (DUF58 family)